MIVGFTGSRFERPPETIDRLRKLLIERRVTEAHHGDCFGFDAQAHDVCAELGIAIVIHPPNNDTMRAWKHGSIILTPKPYIQRNRDIVLASQKIIAAPDGPEKTRSGTWSTIRYAKSIGVRGVILPWPS